MRREDPRSRPGRPLRLVPSARPEFETLFLEHVDRLHGLARRWCRGTADAEDLVQEAALKAYAGFDRLEAAEKAGGWFYRILYRCFCDRAQGIRLEREAPSVAAQSASPGAIDLRIDLQRALETLAPEVSLVVWLAEVEGMTLAEIASALSIPPGTAASRLSRGRAVLRELLGERPGKEKQP
ncbi:MAG: RNA polymerase sigma factor [Acidobacteria bacterium]|nr:RNA polymerase sigma factor [Acidobacteriota bacterium]